MKKHILLTAVVSALFALSGTAMAATVGAGAGAGVGHTHGVGAGTGTGAPINTTAPADQINAATPAQPNMGAGFAATPALPGNSVAAAQVQMNRPVIQAPHVERPTIERPTIERPTVERPTIERPTMGMM